MPTAEEKTLLNARDARIVEKYLVFKKSPALIAIEEQIPKVTVRRIIDKTIDEISGEALNDLIRGKVLHVQELRQLLPQLLPGVITGNTRSISAYNSVMDKIAKIMGYYAPVKVDVTSGGEKLSPDQMAIKIQQTLGLNMVDGQLDLPLDVRDLEQTVTVAEQNKQASEQGLPLRPVPQFASSPSELKNQIQDLETDTVRAPAPGQLPRYMRNRR